MKKNILFTSLILLGLASCSGEGVKNKVSATEAQLIAIGNGQQLTVDTKASSIYWKGTKVGGMHDGTIGIKEGGLMLSRQQEVNSGVFTIDMNSMVNFDLADNENLQAMLYNHLKSADFFDIETYPIATFTITNVEEAAKSDSVSHYVSGNLEMKDVEKNIRFGANISANVTKNGDNYTTIYKAESVVFAIDRTEWNVKFGSKKLFPDLTEMLVDDAIQLKITIVATANPIK